MGSPISCATGVISALTTPKIGPRSRGAIASRRSRNRGRYRTASPEGDGVDAEPDGQSERLGFVPAVASATRALAGLGGRRPLRSVGLGDAQDHAPEAVLAADVACGGAARSRAG